MAKAGLEFAVWDLFGKLRGESLAKMLGGTRDRVEVGVSVGIQKDIDTLINVVGAYLEDGYQRIKLKIKPGWILNRRVPFAIPGPISSSRWTPIRSTTSAMPITSLSWINLTCC